MARDHYIPAAVLGRFSAEYAGVATRERSLAVGRRGKVFNTRAENLGLEKRLYNINSPVVWRPPGSADPGTVDPLINGYEVGLPAVLDQFEHGDRVPLKPWLRVAIPFVTAMFVRGRDFARRFEGRPVIARSRMSSEDNTNKARVLELQRLLAPVTAARWVVLHKGGWESFIVNNLGLIPTMDVASKERGLAIPFGCHAALCVFPQRCRTVAIYDHGWHSIVEHRFLDAREVQSFNRAIAEHATEWIAGANPELVERNLSYLPDRVVDPREVMEMWPFDIETLVAHEFDWHRLCSATIGDPNPADLHDIGAINLSAFAADGWYPPMVYPVNRKLMPSGLELKGRAIRLHLRKPDDFNDYFTF